MRHFSSLFICKCSLKKKTIPLQFEVHYICTLSEFPFHKDYTVLQRWNTITPHFVKISSRQKLNPNKSKFNQKCKKHFSQFAFVAVVYSFLLSQGLVITLSMVLSWGATFDEVCRLHVSVYTKYFCLLSWYSLGININTPGPQQCTS